MVNKMLTVRTYAERWPIAGTFAISRGSKTEAVVVLAELSNGRHIGRGECVPYGRYGESVESVTAAIEAARPALEAGMDRAGLQQMLPPGAARNALDCAMLDLEAKQAGKPAYALLGLPTPRALTTAYTISLGTPTDMMVAAEKAATRALLKVKLGGVDGGDPSRIAAVRRAAPNATLIVDANEGWQPETLETNLAACADAGVELVEQPLPDTRDEALRSHKHLIPICADESVRARASLLALEGKYDAVNIKLDKTGGLTEALDMAADAERMGFALMAGCMVATSLAMAPAMLLAQRARFVDLDGPLLLAKDRPDGLRYHGSEVAPPEPVLWG